jgi:hypothetical protein
VTERYTSEDGMFADGANSVSIGGSMNMSGVEGGSATVEPLPDEVEKLKE